METKENVIEKTVEQPKAIIVILRREEDDKAIRKWLTENTDIKWYGGCKPKDFTGWGAGGRTLEIYGNRLMFANRTAPLNATPTQIKKAYADNSRMHGDGEMIAEGIANNDGSVVFINTKPSVKQAIVELSKYTKS